MHFEKGTTYIIGDYVINAFILKILKKYVTLGMLLMKWSKKLLIFILK